VHILAVPHQVAGQLEGLAAGRAGVGAVAGMGAVVYRQVGGRLEGLAAGGAGEGAVAGMGAQVSRQVAGLREGLAAGGAGVGAGARKGAVGCRQVARPRLFPQRIVFASLEQVTGLAKRLALCVSSVVVDPP
jgi:hypothetical protein